MPAGAGGSLHPPPAGHASARPVPGAGKRGPRRPEGPRRAGGQVLVLSLRQKWRERPAAPTEGRGAGRGWRSGCVESEAARKRGEPASRQGRTPARPSLRGSPPFAGSVAGVKSARRIAGELPGRAGLGALASLVSQRLPPNSSERHRACPKGDLVACKPTPLRQASLCQPRVRPFLAIWSNSGLTSG